MPDSGLVEVIRFVSEVSDVPVVVATLIWCLRYIERSQESLAEMLKECMSKLK